MDFPLNNDISRKIIHVDMDAFYASIEERDNPKYKGQPIIVAKHPKDTKGRGVVTTANYIARKYGIRSAMSAKEAYRRCPKAIFIKPRMDYYKEVSKKIHTIFAQYTDIIEPVAFDEAYLDVTENKKGIASAIKLAVMIKQDIYQQLNLTCSAGISYNKFLAKLASDYQKPNGITWILPDEAMDFLADLPIEKFHGIGKKTVPKMHELGVYNGHDLLKFSQMELIQKFGKMGYDLYRKARGIHNVPVEYQKERKSIGFEKTYSTELIEENEMIKVLRQYSDNIESSLTKNQKQCKTIVLKIRYNNFETITRQKTLSDYIFKANDIYDVAIELWNQIDDFKTGLRLVGLTATSLETNKIYEISLPI